MCVSVQREIEREREKRRDLKKKKKNTSEPIASPPPVRPGNKVSKNP